MKKGRSKGSGDLSVKKSDQKSQPASQAGKTIFAASRGWVSTAR
ncbi:MAG: hypothetical protein ACKO3T_22870 [Planctomycetaceae bacterium]